MKHFKIILVLFLYFTSGASAHRQSAVELNYIVQYKDFVKTLSEKYGIPPEVILSVAMIESGSGRSKVARKLHNHFGIVGKNKVSWSRYKQYESAEASFTDFCEKLTTKAFYLKLKGNVDYAIWIDKISKTGYSTMPKKWKTMVIKTIVKSKLTAKLKG